MTRRGFISSAAYLAAATAMPVGPHAKESVYPRLAPPKDFSKDRLINLASELARDSFEVERVTLPDSLSDLTYDQYRDIRYRREAALWHEEKRGFETEFYHPGFYFDTPVHIHQVENGKSRRVLYSPQLFDWGNLVTPPDPEQSLPFSGFRLRHPLNDPEVWDEFCLFQGASYFRAVAAGQIYGLSARGLAIQTGEPEGEEFPLFTHFWIERPEADAASLVVHALLDSASCVGAYSFVIRPGAETVMDVEMTLFPRREITSYGIGPLTSMFLLDEGRPNRIDDFRPAVHDSQGLLIHSGKGERLWRPLRNPERLEISSFMDQTPRGFGLVQRNRKFDRYEDLEAHYHQRPSCWVEPVGDWGKGAVKLVEIPTEREVHDNIVAFWQPDQSLTPDAPYSKSYRLRWCVDPPGSRFLARVAASRNGPNIERDAEQFIVDFAPVSLADGDVEVTFSASSGTLRHVGGQANPHIGGYRVHADWQPGEEHFVELRAHLNRGSQRVSEVWLYRWSAS